MIRVHTFIKYILIVIVGVGATSCEIVNPPSGIPAYIHIDGFTLTTNSNEGTDSKRITDAWVGVDDNLIGAYFMPSTIPVLEQGQRTITVFPGIIENGIASTREIYPFFEPYTTVIDLAEARIDTIYPVTSYSDDAQFVFIEDFETGNIFGEDLDGNPATNLNVITSGTFEGQRSGRITLLDDFAVATVATTIRFPLPKVSIPIFLEMDYKCEIGFSLGIIGHSGTNSELVTKITFNPREDWNKVYVSLDQEVNLLNADLYQVFFSAEKPNSLQEAHIFLDNIKLLHL